MTEVESGGGAGITGTDAAVTFYVLPGTIRQWAHRGKITVVGTNARGQTLYSVASVARAEAAWRRRAIAARAKRRAPGLKKSGAERVAR